MSWHFPDTETAHPFHGEGSVWTHTMMVMTNIDVSIDLDRDSKQILLTFNILQWQGLIISCSETPVEPLRIQRESIFFEKRYLDFANDPVLRGIHQFARQDEGYRQGSLPFEPRNEQTLDLDAACNGEIFSSYSETVRPREDYHPFVRSMHLYKNH